MKKSVYSAIPFLLMFILATGSVVLSCATAPSAKSASREDKLSINTAANLDGRLYTTWVFGEIRSVMIVDEGDRSRKIELKAEDYRYDPASTEITLLRALPFKNYFASIEGTESLPHTFVLNGIKDEEELMVIISDRLAIAGYDYAFDRATSRLTFRNDVRLKDTDWSIQYSTPFGGTMLGEWKPENEDRLSYLEAEHRRRWLNSWYDKQEAFWFLDEARKDEWLKDRNRSPALIRREATAKELADMKAVPLSVMKFRYKATDASMTREVGFDARVPKTLSQFTLAWRTIEETSESGVLVRRLDVMYEDGSAEGIDQYVLNIRLEKFAEASVEQEKVDWPIDEETVDLGVPVHVVRQWGTQSTDIAEKPTVVKYSTWTWTDGTVGYQAGEESANDERTAALLRQFIAARKK